MGMPFNPDKVRRKVPVEPPSLSALFQPGEGTVVQLPVDQLEPWRDEDGKRQPFRLYPSEKMEDLAQNIRENGVINPCIVRPWNGKYQILAGHNRTEAAKLAGLTRIPCIVKEVDDDLAALYMVDSNLYQREQILPSERASAYELKMRVYRRKGYRSDLAGEEPISAAQRVAEEAGDSARSVNRYVRLLRLSPELLDMVDQGKIPVTAGYDVAGLEKADQKRLLTAMDAAKKSKLSKAQADEITDAVQREGQLHTEAAIEILKASSGSTEPMMRFSIPAATIPKKDRRRLKNDPKLQELLLQTVEFYLNGDLTEDENDRG